MIALSDTLQKFAEATGAALRPYQLDIACAIVDSVLAARGRTFCVLMARQAGKNEVSAVVEAFLLDHYAARGGQIVKASPTYVPQSVTSRLRLKGRLQGHADVKSRAGYIVELGAARCLFLSASPTANVVGATASLLLECDEAQSVDADKWLRDFAPMAASTGATTVFWGTAWTSQTLLARMRRELEAEEARDGARRVFVVDADRVAEVVPAYGRYVAEQTGRLGREHPLIRTQYYLEEVDGEGGLFPAARQARMRGTHGRRHAPTPGATYALLLDVAGAEESRAGADALERAANARRDATACTVVEVCPDPLAGLPTYRVVDRRLWLGVGHADLYTALVDMTLAWEARAVVVDATGIGAGLAQFLARRLGSRVVPVVFTAQTKAAIGWRFVALVDAGRFKDYADDGAADTRQFWYEVAACDYRVGLNGRLQWGVWEAPRYDGLVARGHDDLLLSAALCVELDERPIAGGREVGDVVTPSDPIAALDGGAY
ncbi:MAG: hypothetical protein U0641_11915 [Anaerolineae bacterium]